MRISITLTNGEAIVPDINEVGWWRKLHQHCASQNLKITYLEVDGHQIAPEADAYFCLYETTVLMGDKSRRDKFGVGYWIKTRNKIRIAWYEDGKFAYAEVRRNPGPFIEEISIDNAMSRT